LEVLCRKSGLIVVFFLRKLDPIRKLMIYIWFWPAYKFATLSVFIALGVQVERRLLKKLIERNNGVFED
jgi:hypothetical protein